MAKSEYQFSNERALQFNERLRGTLSDLIGVQIVAVEDRKLVGRLRVEPRLFAANAYLHAATVIGLADKLCGFGAIEHLPPGAENFTTVELKANFIRTAGEGVIEGVARLVHSGRTTQLWDAEVKHANTARTLALVRCTQLLLYAMND